MNHTTPDPATASKKPFSYKPRPDLAPRFHRLVVATKRTKASVLNEMLETALPLFEKQNAGRLLEFDRQIKPKMPSGARAA